MCVKTERYEKKLNTVWALFEFDCTRVDEFCIHDDWGMTVLCVFHRNDGEKKIVFEFHVKKKKKRGTLKERLLASAVALFLWDDCLSFVVIDDDVFIFLVMGKRKKKRKKANQKES